MHCCNATGHYLWLDESCMLSMQARPGSSQQGSCNLTNACPGGDREGCLPAFWSCSTLTMSVAKLPSDVLLPATQCSARRTSRNNTLQATSSTSHGDRGNRKDSNKPTTPTARLPQRFVLMKQIVWAGGCDHAQFSAAHAHAHSLHPRGDFWPPTPLIRPRRFSPQRESDKTFAA